MIQLHAPDSMGQAAHKAAMHASGLDLDLLAARSPDLDRSQRAAGLERAFVKFYALARAMAELEQAAPATALLARQRGEGQ